MLVSAVLASAAQPRPSQPVCAPAPGKAERWDGACLRALYSSPSTRWPAPEVEPGVAWKELAPLLSPVDPPDNPSTPAKVALGRRLFFDPVLSKSRQLACASCHDPDLGWADGRRVSFGHGRQPGRRNAPSVATSAHVAPLFWDGRAATLEGQALHPIADPIEMGFTTQGAVRRLRRDASYRADFAAVFAQPRIDASQLGQAIAAFERSLSPRNSRFDRFLRGDTRALDDAQLRGLHLFRTQAGCMNCHSGAALTDNGFHNLGLHFHGRARQDLGRYEVTGDPADSGRFRTPSLRGVANTAPYMHNGLIPRLSGVLAFYNVGGARPRAPASLPADAAPFPEPDPLLRPRGLGRQDLQDIEAFLQSL
ncbi:MAG: c-type cytochrome [Stenotrophomonas maltophilia]|uniref:cytochrome-c peroxidase n=1 Tax=Stenotrophomonas sp. GD04024 TaxID=2975422 RepID=UPI0013136134|nr:cytochrome c peroxidase [Stenotrophomonas sp. GD04024]MBS4802440.1 c-type cytochrome [Stenotrophomonas maltophilia]MDG9988219.1 c-type cytochrome [Stenotrophomonas sp. GD04024]